MREWLERNRDHVNAYRRRTAARRNKRRRWRYAADDQYREAKKAEVKAYQRNNPEVRLAQRLKRFGIKPGDYRRMLAAQNGCCAICGSDRSDKRGWRLHVDHCHETGRVRGLLCSNCNQGIGKFLDDPDRLERAALYLRR